MPDSDDLSSSPPSRMAAPVPVPPPVAAAPAGKLSADEERQLGDLLARQKAVTEAGNRVRLRVESPHIEFSFAGHRIGTDWTSVPADAAISIMNAAVPAGVTITQES